MKTIFFIRHAKSSWEDMSLRDRDRPLNPRGLRDAPFMAKLLKAKTPQIDKLISSPANRAFTTASYFAEAYGLDQEQIQVENAIYEASTLDVMNIINALDDSLNTVLVFGHNPTFTSLANMFSQQYIPNVPTCGIVEIRSGASAWKDLDQDNSALINFHYPKQYF